MKRILISLALMLMVLPTAAWSVGRPGDPTFDQFYANGVANGWTTYTMAWAIPDGYTTTYAKGAGSTGSAQEMSTAVRAAYLPCIMLWKDLSIRSAY